MGRRALSGLVRTAPFARAAALAGIPLLAGRAITRAAPLAWGAAVAGIWLLPGRAVVVITGVAVAGTLTAAVRATRDDCQALLVRALADVSREAAPRLQPHLLPVRQPSA